jgi:hypothetical protein
LRDFAPSPQHWDGCDQIFIIWPMIALAIVERLKLARRFSNSLQRDCCRALRRLNDLQEILLPSLYAVDWVRSKSALVFRGLPRCAEWSIGSADLAVQLL